MSFFYVSKFEIARLGVEERNRGKIEKLLAKEYKWESQGAKRGKKKEGLRRE
jgi:hypothetical protein